jgi:pimeloyl-ACP methyl ester carboxylesterase
MIEDRRGDIDFDQSGSDGPTVVLVPGSCSTGSAWRPVISRWGGGLRFVTTSLLGYGRTAERRTELDADMSHEAEMLEAVIRHAAGPVHLVGHSFGGLTALAVALRNKAPLLSLSILEAPAPEILWHAGEYGHYHAFRKMSVAYSRAFHAGDHRAIQQMIDFYGGTGTFAGWPQRVRDYAVETTPANLLDWICAYGFRLTPACLSRIEVPTLVLWGGNSHPAIVRANHLLAQCMNAAARCLDGATHFMISTHAEEVTRELARHVARNETNRATILSPAANV